MAGQCACGEVSRKVALLSMDMPLPLISWMLASLPVDALRLMESPLVDLNPSASKQGGTDDELRRCRRVWQEDKDSIGCTPGGIMVSHEVLLSCLPASMSACPRASE
mmetsp:Transcript_275/g.711  ORF Transcript_275/g.711 Transcript_275/m.711 type:complete len:107 (-) Transcript_275:1305-1625(-)